MLMKLIKKTYDQIYRIENLYREYQRPRRFLEIEE
jgi:hypothetical protein